MTTEDARSYCYAKLDDSRNEIRILELLPTIHSNDIDIRLHHAFLPSVDFKCSEPDFIKEAMQKDLFPDWLVHETLQGRFLFEREKEYGPTEPADIFWTHPRTGETFSRSTYIDSTDRPTIPTYEALSHVWGQEDTDDISKIYVRPNDSPSRSFTGCTNAPKTLRIRYDLADTLRHLRQDTSRMLWIDVICINQADITERGHQVRLMREIYQLASRVIAWLGPEQDGSKLALATLERLGEQVELIEGGTWRLNSPDADHPSWALAAVPLPYDDRIWYAIGRLVDRPWFHRLWVWQEAKLANNLTSIVQCGHDQISLYTFARAVRCAASKARTNALTAEIKMDLGRAGEMTLRSAHVSFWRTLLSLTRKDCFDQRDKVYGALGMAPVGIAEKIVPDYNKPVCDVYKDAFLAILDTTGRLDMLLACNLERRRIAGSTWVPDLSILRKRRPRWSLSAFQASGMSYASRLSAPQSEVLEVQGIRCGEIRSFVTQPAPVARESDDTTAVSFTTWAPKSPELMYREEESAMDAFVRTLHMNILRDRIPKEYGLPTFSQAIEAAQIVLTRLSWPNNLANSPTPPNLPDISGTTFITLDNNLMGITTSRPEENDVICALLGCRMPLILRPSDRGAFKVVGTAYIHGMMDAEAFFGPLGNEWSIQIGVDPGWHSSASQFLNKRSGVTVLEDPRLPQLPAEWQRLENPPLALESFDCLVYKHLASGRILNSDPRMLPEALTARGVQLETFRLV